MKDENTKEYWIKAGLSECAANSVANIKSRNLSDKAAEACAIASVIVGDAIDRSRNAFIPSISADTSRLVYPVLSIPEKINALISQ